MDRSHRDLTTLSDRAGFAELLASRRAFERHLRHPVPWLAYPYGGHDARTVALARRAGYLLAVTTVHGTRHRARSPLALPRLRVLDATGVNGLAATLGRSVRRARNTVLTSADAWIEPVRPPWPFVTAMIAPLAVLSASAAAAHPDAPNRPVAAYFERRSYAPGDVARIRLAPHRQHLTADVIQLGPEWRNTRRSDLLSGVEVAEPIAVGPGQRLLRVPIGDWQSGVYAVRLRGAGALGYAPFVLRPPWLGEHRVAVVVPTNTWQAYNFRDADGDGTGDTWYADRERVSSVDLSRAFLDRGVPPKFRHYDVGFLRWLDATGNAADFLAEDDLHAGPGGDTLARLYDLIVFPGHTEYVTSREYDVVERFRDLGGNLAFLSANNFVYRVTRRGDRMVKDRQWRELGRPEAALLGVQYLDWNENRHRNRPYVVRGVGRAPWLFRGTGLRNGSRFGVYGIEIDNRTADSPRGTQLLAELPHIFGRGRSGEMTFYRTRRGAKVFAAGSMNFGGSAMWTVSSRLLDNLWTELSRP